MDQSSSDRLSRVFPGAAGEWIANLGGEKIKQLHVDSLFLPDSEYKAALEKAWALRQGLSGARVLRQGMRRFAQALSEGPSEDDDWLVFRHNLLGSNRLGRQLYIRQAYRTLLEVMDRDASLGILHNVLIGNPGQGKSFFGIYLLTRWLKLGPVMWHWVRNRNEEVVIFERSGDESDPGSEITATSLSVQEAADVLVDGDRLNLSYIADGVAPLSMAPECERSIVIHSPAREVYKEYMKPAFHAAHPYHSPKWEEEELEILRQRLHSQSCTKEQMLDHLSRIDASPRFIFSAELCKDREKQIAEAIRSMTQLDIQTIIPHSPEASHRLVQIDVPNWEDGDFKEYSLTFHNPRIQQSVLDHLLNTQGKELELLLMTTDISGADQHLVSVLCIHCRECPAKFSRTPGGPQTESLVLPNDLEYAQFTDAEEISGLISGDIYLGPTSSTFKAVDSLAFVGKTAYLFQITSDMSHSMNQGVLSLFCDIPEEYRVRFVCALPPGDWDSEVFNSRTIPEVSEARSASDQLRITEKLPLVEKRREECRRQTKIPIPFKPQERRRRLPSKFLAFSSAALWRVC